VANVIKDVAALDRLETAQMTPDEFAAYAIVIGVQPSASAHSPRRLEVTADHAQDLEDLRCEIQRRLPTWRRGLTQSEREQIETRLLMSLMAVELNGDGLCNRVLGGRPLVMARADFVRQHGRMAVAQAAHRNEVALAQRRPAPGQHSAHAHGSKRESSEVETILGVA
jgi:hypothetical protein